MARTPKEHVTWKAFEYIHRERGADWYWAVGIITISIAITAILFKNILFAILIVLSFGMLMYYATQRPELLTVKIDHRGVQIGRRRYPYVSLESFWIDDEFEVPKLILKSKKKVLPYIVVPIEEVESDVVRDHLRPLLPEVEHTEPLTKKLMEYLGF